MNRHYDNYLTRKYPLLYRDRHDSASKTVMFWGFSCGDGWFNIINTLSKALSAPYLQAKYSYEFMKENNAKPELIEEKRLEMEALKLNHPLAVQVKEKFGGLRFYARNITPELDQFIQFAESMAANTCEVCGKRGRRRSIGWVKTLCNEHAKGAKKDDDE